jgi:hypothetical protein
VRRGHVARMGNTHTHTHTHRPLVRKPHYTRPLGTKKHAFDNDIETDVGYEGADRLAHGKVQLRALVHMILNLRVADKLDTSLSVCHYQLLNNNSIPS